MVGKIERVPLRDVWPHEAYGLTKWLAENPDVIGDAVGLTIVSIESEQAAGRFQADMRGEDADGKVIVVENQLERSNHDHLGKLITYIAAFDAHVGIWIVSDPRPEHTAAINWLNEAGAALIYLLKLEAIKIGESQPAPLLTLITGPSEEVQQVGQSKKEDAARYGERRSFWKALLERSKGRTKMFANISPGPSSWIGTGSGKSGITFNYSVLQDSAAVELYIDTGDAEENKSVFDALQAQAEQIEESFGSELEWQSLEGRRACRIRKRFDIGGYRTPEKWAEIHEAIIEAMDRLSNAIRPKLKAL